MVYKNLIEATDSLATKLTKFAGHSIDANHTSYAFDQIARGIDYINRESACVSVSYDATSNINNTDCDVVVTVKGNDINSYVSIEIETAESFYEFN